jgi:Flp pilus assembly pilin Flp
MTRSVRRTEGDSMLKLMMKRLIAEELGQDLAEYGIALAVISVLAALVAIVIAQDVGTLWSQAQNVISSATNAATS